MRRTSPDVEKEIAAAYAAGGRSPAIARRFGCCDATIRNILRRLDKPRRTSGGVFILEETRKQAAELYRGGLSARQIGFRLGYAAMTIERMVRKSGVRWRGRHTHSLDESFFDVIDTEEKAYWLGFIAADGCLSKSKLIIALAGRDREHLELFKTCLWSSAPVVTIKPSGYGKLPSARLTISSVRLSSGLRRLGIHEAKSFDVAPPPLPAELERHYWRGVIDGDGSLGIGRRKSGEPGKPTISLVGSLPMVSGFARFIAPIAGKRPNVHRHKRIFSVSFCGTILTKDAVQHLYGDCCISLRRKQVIANAILSIPQVGHPTWRRSVG